VNAFHLKWGGQIVIGERWLLDMYRGLGIRALHVRYLSQSPGPSFHDRFVWFSIRNDVPGRYRPTSSFSLGVHLGYRL
jgi:hypothetical protein